MAISPPRDLDSDRSLPYPERAAGRNGPHGEPEPILSPAEYQSEGPGILPVHSRGCSYRSRRTTPRSVQVAPGGASRAPSRTAKRSTVGRGVPTTAETLRTRQAPSSPPANATGRTGILPTISSSRPRLHAQSLNEAEAL